MRRRLLVLFMLPGLALLTPREASSDPSGFAFLEVPAGARASALGGAYASLATGVDAAFWNPAGLQGVKGLQVTGAHYEFFEKLRHDQFAIAGRMFGGGIAASLRALYSEPIDERDELGNLTGSFGVHDLEFGLSYGRALSSSVEIGVSTQLVRERIANSAAMTWSAGFGGRWMPASLPGVRLSASTHNLGPSAAFLVDGVKGEPVALPAAAQGGISYGIDAVRGFALRGALEARFTRGRAGVGMVGAELANPTGAALRAGFRLNDSASSFSGGAGYAFQALRLDYAFVPYRLDLGDTHRFAFSTQF